MIGFHSNHGESIYEMEEVKMLKSTAFNHSNLCQYLISSHPCFAKLNPDDIASLVNLAIEKSFGPNQIIVNQGDEIDAIYFILSGSIEVSVNQIPQTILYAGEAVGLSEVGFFSQEGTRSATLTAISEVKLIGWPIITFLNFLQSHPKITVSMQQSAETMLRIHFIKKVAPFSHLTIKQVADLAKNIKEISVEAGTILFKQDELGSECYLIQSGKVDILVKENEKYRSVAILEAPMLFGELALLSNSPRNATAKIIEDCRLLVLEKKQLESLIAADSNTADSFASLTLERARPTCSLDIKHYHQKNMDGETVTILKNTKLGHYFQLSPVGWLIWQEINGKQTIEEITLTLFEKHNIFSPSTVSDIIFNLVESGFVHYPTLPFLAPVVLQEDSSWFFKFKFFLQKFLFIRLIFRNFDSMLTKSYETVIHYLFNLTGHCIIAVVILIGFVFFSFFTEKIVLLLPSIQHPVFFIFLLFLIYYFLTIFHELGHAYAVKFFGHEVRRAGLVFYWLGLFVFVDTSDMWLSSKIPRILVSLAGPYVDLLIAGIVSIIAVLLPYPHVSVFFWCLALLLYLSVISNLNPLNDGDGGHVMANAVSHSHIQVAAVQFLKQKKMSLSLFKKHKKESIFGLVCLIFLMINIMIAVIAQYYLRLILPDTLLGIATTHLLWLLPSIVIMHFIFKIKMSFKKYN